MHTHEPKRVRTKQWKRNILISYFNWSNEIDEAAVTIGDITRKQHYRSIPIRFSIWWNIVSFSRIRANYQSNTEPSQSIPYPIIQTQYKYRYYNAS